MTKILAVLMMSLVLSCCSKDRTDPFNATDQMTFAMATEHGYTEDFISRLRFEQGNWKIEHRDSKGAWQDVTCEDKCKLSESTEHQIESLRGRAKVPYGNFKCLQDAAFAFCKSGSGNHIRYFLIGGLEESQVRVGMLKKLNPATLVPIEP